MDPKRNSMITIIRFILLLLVFLGCSREASLPLLEHHWQGELLTPPINVPVELEIVKNGRYFRALLSIPSEKVLKLSAELIEFRNNRVEIDFPELALYFTGNYDSVNQRIDCRAVRGRELLPMTFRKISRQSGVVGQWQGALDFRPRNIHLEIVFSSGWFGAIGGKFFSPELNAANVPLTDVRISNDSVLFKSSHLGGFFEGAVEHSQQRIRGTWHWQFSTQVNSLVLTAKPLPELLAYQPPPKLADGWKVAETADAQHHTAAIESLFATIRRGEWEGLQTLLIAKDQKIVVETYPGLSTANTRQQLGDITLVVTSLLANIAAADGAIDGLSAKMWPYLSDRSVSIDDSLKRQITIKHLLKMQSGLACNDWSRTALATSEKIRRGRDWVALTLNLPMQFAPGEAWLYCAMNYTLLGAVVEKAVGERLDRYAAGKLFTPMQISDATQWGASPAGQIDGGGFLQLTSRDLAKFGQLLLNHGHWYEQRVVSEVVIDSVLQNKALVQGRGAPATYFSGGWWHREINGMPVMFAKGSPAQYLIVAPESQLVAVVIGDKKFEKADDLFWQLFSKYIMPFANPIP
jgi:CubicO group peptidase (beta-lactamase class C family)